MTLENRKPMIFISASHRQNCFAISSPINFDSEYAVSGRPAYSSSTGAYGGGVSNGNPSTVSLDAQTMFLMPNRQAAANTLYVLSVLFWKTTASVKRCGAGIAARCTMA